MSKVDLLDKNDVKKISKKTVHNWNQMINKNKKLQKTSINVTNTRYIIDNNNLVRTLKPICQEISIEIGLFTPIKKT